MKELHGVIMGTKALAPSYTMPEDPKAVHNNHGTRFSLQNLLLWNFLPVFGAETCLLISINILPPLVVFFYDTRAFLPTMSKIKDKPKFEQ